MSFKHLLSAPFQKIRPVAAKWRPKQTGVKEPLVIKPPRLREVSVRYLSTAWCALEQQPANVCPSITIQDRAIVERIQAETNGAIRSNLLRAEAYRVLYFRRPELHGALLAHIMTRNIGYYMTDLQGELLPRLIDAEKRKRWFLLLERLDAAAFKHTYPQLLLYEAGKKEGKELTHLLPFFGISRFMQPVWNLFWHKLDRAALTTALIVNEQRIMSRELKKEANRPLLPETFSVILPYGASLDGGMKLAGVMFKQPYHEEVRIEAMKRLYVILFGLADIHEGVLSFVRGVPHSGSRADYAPDLFTAHKSAITFGRYKQKLIGSSIIQGRRALYSPRLEEAWPDTEYKGSDEGGKEDWFVSVEEVCPYFRRLPAPERSEVFQEHCSLLRKLELAVQAAERERNRPIN
ncbi:DUF2515 family protein [Paenibacillus sp. GCM10027626]|uniref:DUF2515 family protein n=1 Tax=Paenibacillus sp. GCM10027626 TaxID=3273411 RepID=UPI0036273BB2